MRRRLFFLQRVIAGGLILFCGVLTTLAKSIPSQRPHFQGLKIPSERATFGFYPELCRMENQNSQVLAKIFNDGEKVLQVWESKIASPSATPSDPSLVSLFKNYQKDRRILDQNFGLKLGRLNKKFQKFQIQADRPGYEDAMGIHYLILLAERFELSAEKMGQQKDLYHKLLQGLTSLETSLAGKELRKNLQSSIKILEGAGKVYLSVASCHRKDSAFRLKKAGVDSQFGFSADLAPAKFALSYAHSGDKGRRPPSPNIFERSREAYLKFNHRKNQKPQDPTLP